MKRGPMIGEEQAQASIADWLRRVGVIIPPAEPIGVGWNANDLDAATVLAMSDEERDDYDGLIITPDVPDIDQLAYCLVCMARERTDRFPHRWSWRRWKLTGWVSSFLYASGIAASGGSFEMNGRDPVGGCIYYLPSLRSFSPRHRRPYILWRWRNVY